METPDVERAEEQDGNDDDRDEVEALADEFIARRRKGETPSLEDYASRCPDRAEEIRQLFPAIAAMERWKPRPSTPRRALGGGPIRERIGEYRLIREIGRGGMGIVYEAEQESLGRRVAIKVLPGGAWADDRPMQRFLREAKTAGGLRHGHIVPVFAVGDEEGLHYYVMPLIGGAGLDRIILELRERKIASIDRPDPFESDDLPSVARALIGRVNLGPSSGSGSGLGSGTGSTRTDVPSRPSVASSGTRHWRAIAEVGRQVAEALQHAHEQGVLHRDIKPANLLLDAEGVAWVADFGLAKAMSHDDLSRTGDLVGTLRYMAPERLRGEADARSDVYSLGLTLYEVLTLRPAHDVPDRAELIRKIAEAEPTRPGELDPSIPIDLETVILKAIEADPKRRYDSAGAMAADLARFVEGRPVLARRTSALERLARWVDRNRAMAALALFTVALSLFGGYFFRLWLLAPPRPEDNPRAQPPVGRPRPDRPPPPWFRPPPPRADWPPPR